MQLDRAVVARAVSCSLVLLTATSCVQSDVKQEVARLRVRLDSFAVTLTAVTKQLQARSAPPGPDSLTVSTDGAATLGRQEAPVTIVEFTDYQCPFCARHATQTFPQIKHNYIDRGLVRYVVRDLPLMTIHPYAVRGARAARCAGAQSPAAYWAYHDALFAEQAKLADSSFTDIAAQIGLDRTRFGPCFSTEKYLSDVRHDADVAQKLGLNSTPQFIIGRAVAVDSIHGMVLSGALPYSAFEATIDAALKSASRKPQGSGGSSQ